MGQDTVVSKSRLGGNEEEKILYCTYGVCFFECIIDFDIFYTSFFFEKEVRSERGREENYVVLLYQDDDDAIINKTIIRHPSSIIASAIRHQSSIIDLPKPSVAIATSQVRLSTELQEPVYLQCETESAIKFPKNKTVNRECTRYSGCSNKKNHAGKRLRICDATMLTVVILLHSQLALLGRTIPDP